MKENDRNDTGRLVDEHFNILIEDLGTCYSRLDNLRIKWNNRAEEGLLPDPSHVGVFDVMEAMLDEHARKLNMFFIPPFQKPNKIAPNPARSFEDILELTDGLEDIHKALAITERSYWQRLEGYVPPAGSEATRRGTVSESGAIQQIFNAADILCTSYWNSMFNDPHEYPWVGLPVFGEYHEFRYWKEFIFAPDYVRLRFTRSWIYFSHEVSHQVVEELRKNEQFEEIYQDLVELFSRYPTLTWHSPPDYLATETITDILATLISGEQYVLTLADLKYYPSFTVFFRQHLVGRRIQYPLLLRVLLCSLTIRLAWGFQKVVDDVLEDQIFYRIIDRVRKEDVLSLNRIRTLLEKTDGELKFLTEKTYSAETLRQYLSEISAHLDILENIAIPNVISSILKEKTIHRLKRFVKSDFYHTNSTDYYYDVDMDKFSKEKYHYLINFTSDYFIKTPEAEKIDSVRENRIEDLRNISVQLSEYKLVNEEPRDIIACLSNLLTKTNKASEEWNHVALCSIFCRKRADRMSSNLKL
jgi:hypothetical protein